MAVKWAHSRMLQINSYWFAGVVLKRTARIFHIPWVFEKQCLAVVSGEDFFRGFDYFNFYAACLPAVVIAYLWFCVSKVR